MHSVPHVKRAWCEFSFKKKNRVGYSHARGSCRRPVPLHLPPPSPHVVLKCTRPFPELGAEQEKHRRVRRRADPLEVHQKHSDADDELDETGTWARQHVPAGVRVHQRVPVCVLSSPRVRAPVPADDQAVHRVGRAEIRHGQPLLHPHEVRAPAATFSDDQMIRWLRMTGDAFARHRRAQNRASRVAGGGALGTRPDRAERRVRGRVWRSIGVGKRSGDRDFPSDECVSRLVPVCSQTASAVRRYSRSHRHSTNCARAFEPNNVVGAQTRALCIWTRDPVRNASAGARAQPPPPSCARLWPCRDHARFVRNAVVVLSCYRLDQWCATRGSSIT